MRLCTRNVSRALIERPYSREPQAVGAVYDRPGCFVQALRWPDGPEARKVHQSPRKLPSLQLEAWRAFPEILNLRRIGVGSCWLHPQIPVERAVLHRFGKMFGFEVFGAFEIRYRAGHFENPNNCARGLVVCDLDV